MGNFDYQKLPSGYPDQSIQKGLKKGRGFQANWHDVIYKKVRSFIEPNNSHLDWACGPGIFIGNYCDNNSIGIDISEVQIEYAKKNYGNNGTYIVKDGNNLDSFDHNSFDIVTMLDFIEHIEDDEAIGMLNNIYNFLKPGGKLILTTPNYRSLYTILEMIVNVVGPVSFKEQPINKFNARRLNELLKISKFQHVKVDKFLNFSCFLSIFSVTLAQKLDNIIDKIFYGFFGYVLVAELKK